MKRDGQVEKSAHDTNQKSLPAQRGALEQRLCIKEWPVEQK